MKHTFEPTDNQGYSMQCIHCGIEWSVYDKKWDIIQEEDCKYSFKGILIK